MGTPEAFIKDTDRNQMANASMTLNNGQTTTTDTDGHFELDNVTTGSSNLTISQDGHHTTTQGMSPLSGRPVIWIR